MCPIYPLYQKNFFTISTGLGPNDFMKKIEYKTILRKFDKKTKLWYKCLISISHEILSKNLIGENIELDLLERRFHQNVYSYLILGKINSKLISSETNCYIYTIDEDQSSEKERLKKLLI